MTVRTFASTALDPATSATIRGLLRAAFADDGEGFTDLDWAHALGGVHAVAEVDGAIVAHASVVPRTLEIAGRPIHAGYVEAVATDPRRQGGGHGSAVMRAVGAVIAGSYELGVLSTGAHGFYERLGWERWQGSTGIRTDAGVVLTPDEDDGIMILRTPATPPIDPGALMTCEWREGDAW